MNPFLVLNLPLGATDADVRAAYQSLLRRFPPERRPEKFQIIQEAYQSLRTERERWNWRLDRKSTRLNSSHPVSSRMPSSA